MNVTHPNSSHSVSWNPLWIPEIAQLTFRFSGKADGCRLARTCQQLFYSLMPLVWEDICGAEHLLALFQGVQIIAGSNLEVHVSQSSLLEQLSSNPT